MHAVKGHVAQMHGDLNVSATKGTVMQMCLNYVFNCGAALPPWPVVRHCIEQVFSQVF